MSSVYVLEPPTRGKVILNTSEGPLDIELWPKEAPKAVRNFVQLCIEGYYDNTMFHRVIGSFMVQGGDRTGTGTGGESIYGAPFADEFHSRLRFSHRGLVACANPGTPNSNNSQFFITLDRCDWLDRKNTIFGKVTGDTVYNLLKLGSVETGADDRPLEPIPMVLSTEVLWCPFDNIIPRQSIQAAEVPVEDKDAKSKAKKVKKLNLLSFGEEAQQEEEELATLNVKIKSSHDVLDDPRLLKGDIENAELATSEEKRKELQASVREALSIKKKGDSTGEFRSNDNGDGTSDEEDEDFDAAMRRQVLDKIKKFDEGKISKKNAGVVSAKRSTSGADRTLRDDEDEDASAKHERLSLKRKGLGSEARAGLLLKVDVDAQLLGPVEQQRHLHKQKKRSRQGREQATLEKLKQFQNDLLKAKMELSKTGNGDEDKEEDSGWLAHQLKFATDKQKDKMARNDDLDQYVVHDPLLEKGKEKFNKLQAKMKRREREWAGKSLT